MQRPASAHTFAMLLMVGSAGATLPANALVPLYVSRTMLQADPTPADLHAMSKAVHHHTFCTTRIGADLRRSVCSACGELSFGPTTRTDLRRRVGNGLFGSTPPPTLSPRRMEAVR